MNKQDTVSAVKRDYTRKIQGRYEHPSDINEFISLINYCFLKKNDFFVENFNKKITKNIYLCYNQLKTNILDVNNDDLLYNINTGSLKSVKFILTNFFSNFDQLTEDEPILLEFCSKQGIKRFLDYIDARL